MSTAVASEKKVWTTEELLALPDDGVERWLRRGELRERHPTPENPDMTKRNRFHSVTEGRVTGRLFAWLMTQPEPRGEVVCGEVGFILQHDPETTVGIDAAVISAAMADANPDDTTMFDGVPSLAVEIRSPYDTEGEVAEKVDDYLDAGTPVVWVISPAFRTVTVHRPGVNAVALDSSDTLDGGAELPGFSCPVADLFR
jgi:Uma2 family endonuclease